MFNIVIYLLIAIQTVSITVATIWLYQLYIKNHSYVRDIFLIAAGHINGTIITLCLMYTITKNWKFLSMLAPLTLLSLSCFSEYLMTNIKISAMKWPANISKSIVLAIVLFACIQSNVVVYHLAIILILFFDEAFALINGNSALTKIMHIFLPIGAFFTTYTLDLCFLKEYNPLYFVLSIMAYDIVTTGYMFHRIGELDKLFELKPRAKRNENKS